MGSVCSLPAPDGGPDLEWLGPTDLKPGMLRTQRKREPRRRAMLWAWAARASATAEGEQLRRFLASSPRGLEDFGSREAPDSEPESADSEPESAPEPPQPKSALISGARSFAGGRSVSFCEDGEVVGAMSFHATSDAKCASQRSRMVSMRKGRTKQNATRSRPTTGEAQVQEARGRTTRGRDRALAEPLPRVQRPVLQMPVTQCRTLSAEMMENLPAAGMVRSRAQSFERGESRSQTPRGGDPDTSCETPRRVREPRQPSCEASIRSRPAEPELRAHAPPRADVDLSRGFMAVSAETKEMLQAAMRFSLASGRGRPAAGSARRGESLEASPRPELGERAPPSRVASQGPGRRTRGSSQSLPRSRSLSRTPSEGSRASAPREGSVGSSESVPPSARAASADRKEQDAAWADFAMRAEALVGVWGAEAPALFEVFRATADVRVAYATFAVLWRLAFAKGEGASHRFPYQALKGALQTSWKARKLWQLLDERVARPEYKSAPCKGLRVLVVGAGPCGLRAAIELRLLGAEVVVVDRRVHFSRINQLHLWGWCGEELKALGARILEPPPMSFGANPDLLHVCVSDLQQLLLKVALLLGAEVLLGTDFLGTAWSEAEGNWQATLSPAAPGEAPARSSWPPSPAAPPVLRGISAVVVANGFGSTLGQTHGLQVVETQSVRQENAIGLVCNLKRSNGGAERNLRSFSMAAQFYAPLFSQVTESTGAELENVLYTKGQSSHYFVMTPTHRCLSDAGVIIDKTSKPLLAPENVDMDKLDAFVRRVASFQFKEGEPAVLDAAGEDLKPGDRVDYADGGPRLFDFSRMRRHTEAIAFVSPDVPHDADDGPGDLLVAVVGDALIEPFWPEGLGIVRGFFSVLDASSGIAAWAAGASRTTTRRHVESAYQHLKTLGVATRSSVLREDESLYALDPASRYRGFSAE